MYNMQFGGLMYKLQHAIGYWISTYLVCSTAGTGLLPTLQYNSSMQYDCTVYTQLSGRKDCL